MSKFLLALSSLVGCTATGVVLASIVWMVPKTPLDVGPDARLFIVIGFVVGLVFALHHLGGKGRSLRSRAMELHGFKKEEGK